MLNDIPVETRREGVAKGGYVALKEQGELQTILLSCGSELQHAIAAAKELGAGVRVVSIPCTERFNAQSAEYRESVLPSACRRRVAIEAGVSDAWHQYVGLDGKVVGINRFGLSGPGAKVMDILGMSAKSVVEAVKSLS
jgi:transketolase